MWYLLFYCIYANVELSIKGIQSAMTTRSPESNPVKPEALKERRFDVAGVKVSEHFATKPDFVLKESEIDSDNNELIGYAVEAGEDESYEKNTAFLFKNDGSLSWNVDAEGSIGLVLAREDGSINQLGVDSEEKSGIIRDIGPNDELFMLSNTTISKMQATDSFKKNGLDLLVDDASMRANIVHVTFDEAISYQQEGMASVAGERRSKHSIRLRRQAEKLGLPIDATAEQIREAKSKKKAAKQAQAAAASTTSTSVATTNIAYRPKEEDGFYPQIEAYDEPLGPSLGNRPKEEDGFYAQTEPYTEQLGPSFEDFYEYRKQEHEAASEAVGASLGARVKLGAFVLGRRRQEVNENLESNTDAYIAMSEKFDELFVRNITRENESISKKELAEKVLEHKEALEFRRDMAKQSEIRSGRKLPFIKKSLGEVMESYAGLSKKKKIGIALGAGAVFAVAGGAVAAAGTTSMVLGAAGGFGLGVAKTAKTYMQARSSMYEAPVETASITTKKDNGKRKSAEQIQKEYNERYAEHSKMMIERSEKINKKAMILTLASAALVGAGILGHVDGVRNVYNGLEGGLKDTTDSAGRWLSDSWNNLRDAIAPNETLEHHIMTPDERREFHGTTTSPEAQPLPPEATPEPEPAPDNGETGGGSDPAPAPEQAPVDTIESGLGGGEWQSGSVENYFNGSVGSTEFTTAGVENFNQWIDGYSVQSGDSIWSLSENYLRAQGVSNPSVYQIDAVKDSMVANLQAQGLADANGWLYAGVRM